MDSTNHCTKLDTVDGPATVRVEVFREGCPERFIHLFFFCEERRKEKEKDKEIENERDARRTSNE